MGSYSPDASTTGGNATGFTSPTFTLATDLAPDANSRQHVVTALGGTQPASVRVSSNGDPFTVTMRKFPYRKLPPKNPVTGSYGNVPRNKVDLLFRKGMKIDSAGTIAIGDVRVSYNIPAGAEQSDPENIRALQSFIAGLLGEESADIGDSLVSGIW